MTKRAWCLFGLAFLAGCGGGDSSPPAPAICSVVERESDLTNALAQASSEVDFSMVLERPDGRRFSYERGTSTLTTTYESASTSKWVSAVIILRLVEQGYLDLDDKPQDWISAWPTTASDPLFNLTLRQLLSFSSGLTDEPLCLNLPNADFENCVKSIGTNNLGKSVIPGTEFYYASTHLQVAGLMAVKARGFNSWQDVFAEFKTQTGLFGASSYDLPSTTNPRLAGGMHWTGIDYLNFLKALKQGDLLNATSMNEFLVDRTAGLAITYSPVSELAEEWHYGFGSWHECQSASFSNCTAARRLSSPGAYGAYPYWDRSKNYIGLIARQGALGTFPKGLAIERLVRPQVEAWVDCQ